MSGWCQKNQSSDTRSPLGFTSAGPIPSPRSAQTSDHLNGRIEVGFRSDGHKNNSTTVEVDEYDTKI